MRILTVRGTCATAIAMGTVMKIRPTTARLFLTRRSRISMAMGWAMRATLTATETASLMPRTLARLCRIRPRKTHWTVGLATNAMRPSCSHHWQKMAECGWMQARLAHQREMAVLADRCSTEDFSWGCRKDGDGVSDLIDNCAEDTNPDQSDTDGDGRGDACDADDDNDSVEDGLDNCVAVYNPTQADLDEDGLGDACDPDRDGDGVPDENDTVCTFPMKTNKTRTATAWETLHAAAGLYRRRNFRWWLYLS